MSIYLAYFSYWCRARATYIYGRVAYIQVSFLSVIVVVGHFIDFCGIFVRGLTAALIRFFSTNGYIKYAYIPKGHGRKI